MTPANIPISQLVDLNVGIGKQFGMAEQQQHIRKISFWYIDGLSVCARIHILIYIKIVYRFRSLIYSLPILLACMRMYSWSTSSTCTRMSHMIWWMSIQCEYNQIVRIAYSKFNHCLCMMCMSTNGSNADTAATSSKKLNPLVFSKCYKTVA